MFRARKRSTAWLIGAFSAALFTVTAPAGAQLLPEPIHVSKCAPEQGAVAVAPGFVRGYYPAGPYYWRDVYGYRYLQPAMSTSSPTLKIDYRNVTSKPISEIQFGLVARGDLIAEVRDVGTFSPNIEIRHEFGLNPNVFPIGTGLPRCVPLHVQFADGTTWRSPHLPALRRSLYSR